MGKPGLIQDVRITLGQVRNDSSAFPDEAPNLFDDVSAAQIAGDLGYGQSISCSRRGLSLMARMAASGRHCKA